jgi:hypothetical protein
VNVFDIYRLTVVYGLLSHLLMLNSGLESREYGRRDPSR